MAIHILSFKFDWSDNNVSQKYKDQRDQIESAADKSDFYWKVRYNKDFYINPSLPGYQVFYAYQKDKTILPGYSVEKDEILYEGKVISVFTKTERIMSDVWEGVTYAIVYSPETKGEKLSEYSHLTQEGDYKTVHVRTDGNDNIHNSATVDAPKEMIEKYEQYLKFQEQERKHKEKLGRKAQARMEIRKGKIVQVVSGIKVKPGTYGMVFYVNHHQKFGTSYGIALDPQKGDVVKKGKQYRNTYIHTEFVSHNNVKVTGDKTELDQFLALYAWETGRKNIDKFIGDMNCPGDIFDKMSSVAEDDQMMFEERKEVIFKLLNTYSYPEDDEDKKF